MAKSADQQAKGVFTQTIAAAQGRTSEDELNDRLKPSGLQVKEGRLDVIESDPVEKVERTPQISLEIQLKKGLSITLPWMSFRAGYFHRTSDSDIFLELVFSEHNVFVFGRGLRAIYSFVKSQAASALKEASQPDDKTTPFYVSRLLVVDGSGRSYIQSDEQDVADLRDFLAENPKLKLRPEANLDLAEEIFRSPDLDPLTEHALSDEVGGHPEEVEGIRRGVQHRHRTDELLAAKREGRKVDKSKLRH